MKAAENKGGSGKIAECEIPDKVEISFANQNSCRQVREWTRRREEFDEAFSTSLPVNERELSSPFIILLSSTYIRLSQPTFQVNCVKIFWFSKERICASMNYIVLLI